MTIVDLTLRCKIEYLRVKEIAETVPHEQLRSYEEVKRVWDSSKASSSD